MVIFTRMIKAIPNRTNSNFPFLIPHRHVAPLHLGATITRRVKLRVGSKDVTKVIRIMVPRRRTNKPRLKGFHVRASYRRITTILIFHVMRVKVQGKEPLIVVRVQHKVFGMKVRTTVNGTRLRLIVSVVTRTRNFLPLTRVIRTYPIIVGNQVS